MQHSGHSWALLASVAITLLLPRSGYGQGLPDEKRTAPPSAQPAAAPVGSAFRGFEIGDGGGDWSLTLSALVQADGRFFLDVTEPGDTFLVRRARLDLRATVARFFKLRLQPEFAGSRLSLLDAYVNVGLLPEIELQAGKMKAPIGLELLQSTGANLFAEVGLPSLLVPNRDVGVVLQGKLMAGALEYQAGAFNGSPDGASIEEDTSSDKDFEGRVFVRPFVPAGIEALSGLGLGVAGSHGDQRGGAAMALRTPGRQVFFAYGDTVTARGHRTRVSPQGYYYLGPVGLLGEYVRSTEHVAADATRRGVTTTAWQAVGSFVLGGTADYKGAKVSEPLDPEHGTWGAIEVAARYGRLEVDEDAFAAGLADAETTSRAAENFGAAASWWFVAGSRLQLAFDHTAFQDAPGGSAHPEENVLVTRLQVGL